MEDKTMAIYFSCPHCGKQTQVDELCLGEMKSGMDGIGGEPRERQIREIEHRHDGDRRRVQDKVVSSHYSRHRSQAGRCESARSCRILRRARFTGGTVWNQSCRRDCRVW